MNQRYFYVIKADCKPPMYKLGQSWNPRARLALFKTECLVRLELFHQLECEDSLAVERYWHRQCFKRRRWGEWFQLSDAELGRVIQGEAIDPKKFWEMDRRARGTRLNLGELLRKKAKMLRSVKKLEARLEELKRERREMLEQVKGLHPYVDDLLWRLDRAQWHRYMDKRRTKRGLEPICSTSF